MLHRGCDRREIGFGLRGLHARLHPRGGMLIVDEAFMDAEPATATAPFRPATLNALDVEASVTPCSAAARPAATNGVCRAPGRVSEAWI